MFHVKVTNEQIQFVEELLKRVNFAHRGVFDGTYWNQRTGIIGQVVVADLLGAERPKGDGFDGGVDFKIAGYTVDVKTMGRKGPFKPTYVHNFTGSQFKFQTDILLFTSLNTRQHILTICGYLPKKLLDDKSHFFPYQAKRYRDDGTCFRVGDPKGLYEIPHKNLYPIYSIQDFIYSLTKQPQSISV